MRSLNMIIGGRFVACGIITVSYTHLSDKGPATQFIMTTIEELGLLKMDFLGLRNLTVIRDALELIRENHGAVSYTHLDVYKRQRRDCGPHAALRYQSQRSAATTEGCR